MSEKVDTPPPVVRLVGAVADTIAAREAASAAAAVLDAVLDPSAAIRSRLKYLKPLGEGVQPTSGGLVSPSGDCDGETDL